MKVAVYTDNLLLVSSWKVRLIENLLRAPDCEVLLVLSSSEKKVNSVSLVYNAIKNLLINHIFKVQYFVESKVFGCNIETTDKIFRNSVIEKINDCIVLNNPTKMNLFNEDLCYLSDHELDVIINLEGENMPKDLLSLPRYGVWGLSTIFDIGRYSSINLTSFFSSTSTVSIDLIRYSPNESCITIDTVHFNPHWSLLKLNEMVLGTLPLFVLKNITHFSDIELINNSRKWRSLSYKKSNFSIALIFRYVIYFYLNLIYRLFDQTIRTLLNVNRFQWSLFLGKGSAMDIIRTEDLLELKPPKNHFWADPFLFHHQDKQFVFFENYCYHKKKGIISCGEISDGKINYIRDVLSLEYHLSYPYVFEEDNEIYMLPETSGNKRLEIYKCITFPDEWELYSTGFDNEGLCDTFLYKDDNNQWWLFTNKSSSLIENYNNELYLYKIDSLKLESIIPHKKNPVIINSNYARNGGCLFTHEGKLIRPCQRNINGVYGYGIDLRSVELLSIDDYKEQSVKNISPENMKGFDSIHHLHQQDNIFVIDGVRSTQRFSKG